VHLLSTPPRVIFFFKLPRHTMRDVLAFVASQLLGREDAQAATWQRVEELLRLRVSPQPEQRGWHAQPVLLVLDSLSDEERTKMRQIVGRMGGRVRCVLGVDTHSQLQADRTLAALPPQRNAHVIPLQPLSMPERAAMLGRLLQRSGAAHVPANLQHVTASAAAGAPLYLAMVAAYLKACVLLGVQPAPLKALKQDATALLTFDLLPTIESAVGEKQLRVFLEVVAAEPAGRTRKEISTIMHKVEMPLPEQALARIMDATRALSDPAHAEHGGAIAFSRHAVVVAIARRYRAPLAAGAGVTPLRAAVAPHSPGDPAGGGGGGKSPGGGAGAGAGAVGQLHVQRSRGSKYGGRGLARGGYAEPVAPEILQATAEQDARCPAPPPPRRRGR